MFGLTRSALTGLLCVVTGTSAAIALPSDPMDRAEAFAICSGRLEAVAVHGRSHARVTGDEIDRLAREFALLFDATAPLDVTRATRMAWRSAGWSDAAYLLNELVYSFDDSRSERASRLLRQKILNCTDMLLPDNAPGWVAVLTRPGKTGPAPFDGSRV